MAADPRAELEAARERETHSLEWLVGEWYDAWDGSLHSRLTRRDYQRARVWMKTEFRIEVPWEAIQRAVYRLRRRYGIRVREQMEQEHGE